MRWHSLAFFFFAFPVVFVAQSQATLDSTRANWTLKRRTNTEWVISSVRGSLELPTQGVDGTTLSHETKNIAFFGLGYGAHIPLATLTKHTTLWLVPTVSGLFSFDGVSTHEYQSNYSYALVGSAYLTYGYGALGRVVKAIGFDAGLGISIAHRFELGTTLISPSLLAEFSIAPGPAVRFRIMVDLTSSKFGNNASYHSWGYALVLDL